jgi:hypothetical protein
MNRGNPLFLLSFASPGGPPVLLLSILIFGVVDTN